MQENFPHRAKVLISQSRYQEAIQICRDGLLAHPEHVEGKVLLGMALLALRHYDQVCKEIEPLVEKTPNHALANRLLGEAHLRLGHTAHARQHLEAAKQVQPDSPATLELLEELDRATRTGERRHWPDSRGALSPGDRTPLLSDDDEETATASDVSPLLRSNRSSDFGLSHDSRFDAFGDNDDEGDETVVGDRPSMDDIRRAFPPSSGVAARSAPPPLVADADEMEENTLAVENEEPPEVPDAPDIDDDDGAWDESDATVATVLPEYRQPPITAPMGEEVLPSNEVTAALEVPTEELSPLPKSTSFDDVPDWGAKAEVTWSSTEQSPATEPSGGDSELSNVPDALDLDDEDAIEPTSIDISVQSLPQRSPEDEPARAEEIFSFSSDADASPNTDLSDALQPSSNEVADQQPAQAPSSEPEPAPEDEPSAEEELEVGLPDPDVTRVLDAASAAIIRASSGAPMKQRPPEVKIEEASHDQHAPFVEEPQRDLEGTDSFSALAEGTMVDEESLHEVRKKLKKNLGSFDELAALDRSRPVTSDDIIGPDSLSLDDGDIEEEHTTADAELSLDSSLNKDASRESSSQGDESAKPQRISSRLPGLPSLEKKEDNKSDFLDRIRNRSFKPNSAAKPPEGNGFREDSTVNEIPEDAAEARRGSSDMVSPLQERATQSHRSEESSGSSAPPVPPRPKPSSSKPPRKPEKFIAATTSPTAIAVPSHKPGESSKSSERSAPPPPVPAKEPLKNKKKTLLGFGPNEPGKDPLDAPLDPSEFPRSKPLIPEVSTSIPLKTGDLMVGEPSEDQEPPAPPSPVFPTPVKRTMPGPPASSQPPARPSDPLDQPFDPGDFSSHRIPLPEARPGADAFNLDNPLNPEEFGRQKASPVRPLPPMSPLDQPISPEDFTPGPRRKEDFRDPLSEPFWPEDFEESAQQNKKSSAFKFGRAEVPKPSAPPPPPPPPPSPGGMMSGDEDLETHAIDSRLAIPSYEPSAPPPPPPQTPPTRSAVPDGPPDISADPGVELLEDPSPFDSPAGFDAPKPRKVTKPIDAPLRDELIDPLPPNRPPPEPSPPRSPPDRSGQLGQMPPRPEPRPEPGPRQAEAPRPEPSKRQPKKGGKKRLGLIIGGVAVFVAVVIGVVFGILSYLGAAEIEGQRSEAQELMLRGNYNDYAKAAEIYDDLIENYDEPQLLVEAARVNAVKALEFGAEGAEPAEELIKRAIKAGVPEQELAPARAALDIHRGDLVHADKVLHSTQFSTGDDAPELIYLRGLWYLRRDIPQEALRRFAAASQATPEDVRMSLAEALALYRQGSVQDALQKLDEVEQRTPQNVASRLLRAKINIEEQRHFEGGDQAARQVIEELASQASSGQLGWAKLLRARYFIKREKNTQARDLAVAARDSRPTRDPEFSSLLAKTFLSLNDFDAARLEAKRAVELAPHMGRYRLLLAEALLEVNELDAAESQLRPVTNSPKAALLQGRILLARDDLSGAEPRFREAAQGEREAPQAKLYLAQVYLRQKRNDQAIELLEKLAEGPPALPEARILLGDAYLRMNRLEQAEKTLEIASNELPNEPGVSISLGKLYARKGDPERAIRSVQKALTIDPNQPDALVTLGRLQLSTGARDEAAESFEKALEIRPSNSVALIGRARVATAKREYDEASSFLDKAADKAAPGLVELARGELELKRYTPSEAIPHLKKAADARPNDPVVHALLGDAYVLRGDRASRRRASSAFRKVLKLRRDDPHAYVGLAEVALLGSNISAIRNAIDRAVEGIEGADVSKTLKARMHTLKGRYSFEFKGESGASRTELERALELDENLAEAHISLGFVAEAQSRSRDACTHFKRYLELAENGPRIDVADARRGQREHCR